ncbi:hypothetical protein [Smaragdicoccus niigatensis]|uniref:hypothetical protein n=1 Tax=Smaragdicoccus niigatensis TaxID=359359 RepID=UPI00036E8638|nr:hypothetical protein [Smaragdicoccus niigatensis]
MTTSGSVAREVTQSFAAPVPSTDGALSEPDERLRLLKLAAERGMTLDDLKRNPGYFISTGREDDEEW